ncbi:MAG: sigma-54-dependent Fis family transcriptional regulator [Candidatus Rokubacteria bacterium]|nr:sigma-54-dependent Fis family transcriptional regulator [Candidatus Rokubacteria bacterium]
MIPAVLIIEDEKILSEAMQAYLGRHGYDPTVAGSGEEGLQSLRESEADLVVLDYKLPRMDGLETLRQIKQLAPGTEVVMLTAHGTVKSAVEAMRAGAFDYLTKPVDLEELAVVLDKAWSHARLQRELRYWQDAGRKGDPRERIIGDSETTRQLRRQVERLASLERAEAGAPAILITGETGTGKGLVARTIHDLSPRADRPFVEVNCAAIPLALLESEIFGYERGAFTDARAAKAGLFEAADGGTLFLDEIGAMPLELQVKLLKVIEEKSVRRLGGLRPKVVDVRIIAATNTDLDEAVRSGGFRPDLLYRLKVLTLALPPLRERPEDIPPLARHYLAQAAREYRRPRRLHPDAEARLVGYPWPGNVRELANVLERVVLLHEAEEIHADDLGLGEGSTGGVPRGGAVDAERGAVRVDFSRGGVSLADLERTLIVEALKAAGGNRRRAAELLDISAETLRYRVEKYGIAAGEGSQAR